jgi:Tfp pilus assembly protein PilO
MTDPEQRTAHRRSSAGRRESDLMDVVHAADSGISMGWRWAQIVVTILSAAFVAGTAWNGFDNMREEIKGLRADVAQVRVSQTATDKQNALDRKDIDRLDKEVSEMRRQFDQQRDMREAMIYSSANATLRKQATIPTTP